MQQNLHRFDRPLLRTGSIAFIAGVVIVVVSTMLHPSREDPANHPLVFMEYANTNSWIGTGLGFTAINIVALAGVRRGEEGLASGLINTSRQIGGPIGLAVLLTVANFETPSYSGHLVVQSTASMVTGFGYAFLAAALLTGIGIIFTALLKQERHRQAPIVDTA